MLLQGKVVGESVIEFQLSDVIGTYLDDDVLYIKGDVPIVYSTIRVGLTNKPIVCSPATPPPQGLPVIHQP